MNIFEALWAGATRPKVKKDEGEKKTPVQTSSTPTPSTPTPAVNTTVAGAADALRNSGGRQQLRELKFSKGGKVGLRKAAGC